VTFWECLMITKVCFPLIPFIDCLQVTCVTSPQQLLEVQELCREMGILGVTVLTCILIRVMTVASNLSNLYGSLARVVHSSHIFINGLNENKFRIICLQHFNIHINAC